MLRLKLAGANIVDGTITVGADNHFSPPAPQPFAPPAPSICNYERRRTNAEDIFTDWASSHMFELLAADWDATDVAN